MTRNTDTRDYTSTNAFDAQSAPELATRLIDILSDPTPPVDHPDRGWWRFEISRLMFGATDADMVGLLTQICLVLGLPDDFRTGVVDGWVAYITERRGY